MKLKFLLKVILNWGDFYFMNGWRKNLNRELLGLSQKLHCTVNQYAKFNTDKTYNVDTHKVQ